MIKNFLKYKFLKLFHHYTQLVKEGDIPSFNDTGYRVFQSSKKMGNCYLSFPF